MQRAQFFIDKFDCYNFRRLFVTAQRAFDLLLSPRDACGHAHLGDRPFQMIGFNCPACQILACSHLTKSSRYFNSFDPLVNLHSRYYDAMSQVRKIRLKRMK